MAITGSVGVGGYNRSVDVKLIQAALNRVESSQYSRDEPLVVDGLIGARTNAAIRLFQEQVVGMRTADSRVDPDGQTLQILRQSAPKAFSLDTLRAIMGHCPSDAVDCYYPILSTLMAQHAVNTPLRMAHFLAQIGHESLSLQHTEELASGEAYEGRADLGNTEPGDGVRFKGRGLIQLTGRSNYAAYGEHLGLDLLRKGQETLPAKFPYYAVDVSLWFWDSRQLNQYADDDDLRAITRRINGGYNGLDDRADYLARAQFFLL